MITEKKQAPSGVWIEYTQIGVRQMQILPFMFKKDKTVDEAKSLEFITSLIVSINGVDAQSNTITSEGNAGKQLASKISRVDGNWLSCMVRNFTYPDEPIVVGMEWENEKGEKVKKEHTFAFEVANLETQNSRLFDEVGKEGYNRYYKPFTVKLPIDGRELICYPPSYEKEIEIKNALPKHLTFLAKHVSYQSAVKSDGKLEQFDWTKEHLGAIDLRALNKAYNEHSGSVDTTAEFISPFDSNVTQKIDLLTASDFFQLATMIQ